MEKALIQTNPADCIRFAYVSGSPMRSTLIVENNTSQQLHLLIYTTLSRQITIEPHAASIEASQSLAVQIALAHEININYALEKIAVFASFTPYLYGYVTGADCYRKIVSIAVESVVEEPDTRPEFVRINQSTNFKATGNQLFKAGNYEKALQSYQQAIAVYRYDVRYFSNEVLALRKLKRFGQAIQTTEKILLFDPNNAKVLLARAMIYAELSQTTESAREKLYLLKQALWQIELAKRLPALNVAQDNIHEIEVKIKIMQERVGAMNAQQFSSFLLEKARKISQAQFDSKFSNLFSNIEEYNEYAKQALKVGGETPEFVLDPLSYEILRNPLIVSSGLSYDQHVLKQLFAYKGPIDPISKIPLNLNLIFPNRDLASFINNNEQLKVWRETQAQILHAGNDIEF